jgi:lipopolysaccharide export system permease protein
MRILKRYIASHVIMATIFVTLVFLGVQTFISFVEQLSDMGQQQYHLIQSVQFVLFNLPSDFYSLFPVIGLLGCLLGLGYLASSNQLIVMQSSGVSILKITWAVIRAAIVMLVFVTFVGEVMAPGLKNRAINYKALLMKEPSGFAAFPGAWLHYGNDFIHINHFDSPKKLSQLTIYSLDKTYRLKVLYRAEEGTLQNNQTWLLTNVTKTSFLDDKVITSDAKEFSMDIDIKPEILISTIRDPSTLTLSQSYRYIRYFNRYNLNTFFIDFNFWQRVIQPLTTLVMIALSVPFIFGSLRNVSTGCRIVVGIIVGLGFYILNQFFGPFSLLFQLPSWLAAVLPTFIFLLICILMLYRVKV